MPRLSSETISLIQEMTANNRLWGRSAFGGSFSSWVFGEVKRTIQKDMKQTCPRRVGGQNWKTFLRNHATEIWACDFLQVTDLFFRRLRCKKQADLLQWAKKSERGSTT